MLCHVPGLMVVYPSSAYEVKGLTMACIAEDNPTILIKHKKMLGVRGPCPRSPMCWLSAVRTWRAPAPT